MNELSTGEYELARVGNHLIHVSNNGGTPMIVVRDHAEFAVEGEHKGDVTIVQSSGEFGASFKQLGEREFWEEYYG